MKITYDPAADALYIRLLDGEVECENRHVNEAVTLDLGPEDQVVGIEILDASRVLGGGHVPSLLVENLHQVSINIDDDALVAQPS